jgi:hypothetical protein
MAGMYEEKVDGRKVLLTHTKNILLTSIPLFRPSLQYYANGLHKESGSAHLVATDHLAIPISPS